MGIRSELYTTEVLLDNRSYFFNVKENRMGDIFLQIVESKKGEGAGFDRHQIVVFAEDMKKVLRGLDDALSFISSEIKHRERSKAEKRAEKDERYSRFDDDYSEERNRDRFARKSERPDAERRHKRVVHIVSKKDD